MNASLRISQTRQVQHHHTPLKTWIKNGEALKVSFKQTTLNRDVAAF